MTREVPAARPVGAARLLAADGPRGVRWVPGAPSPDEISRAARARGWRCWVLDTADVRDKAGLMSACVAAFELPDWFGRNWDALEECLRDLETSPSGGHRGLMVVWSGWERLRRSDPDTFATAVEVFDAVAADVPAWLVVLAGSDVDPGVARWPR